MTKQKRISQLTFGQARVKGITKKRWQRAINISIGLRKYHEQKRIKKPIAEPKPKPEPKEYLTQRRQVALNFVNHEIADTGLIYISIRAITKDSTIPTKLLHFAVLKVYRQQKQELGLESYIKYSPKVYLGIEDKEVSKIEDKKLNSGGIWIEIFYNGKAQKTYKLNN